MKRSPHPSAALIALTAAGFFASALGTGAITRALIGDPFIRAGEPAGAAGPTAMEPAPEPAGVSAEIPMPAPGEAAARPRTGSLGDGRAFPRPAEPMPPGGEIADLRSRGLLLPVEGLIREDLYDSFDDPRGGGRTHEAIDIMAPRGTPVLAVEDGRVAKMDDSQGGGGIVLYQYEPSGRYVYYYAHLDGYAEGIAEGDEIVRGQILGYVGSTGNASPDAPHLHFAIARLGAEGRWWDGVPVNPYSVFR